jgi:hypothetical protein
MTGPRLTYFQLRLPQALDQKAALAAFSSFSGLPFRSRLVFDLEGTVEGITHRIGMQPTDQDLITATLRATIPNLRLEPVATPAESKPGHLVQLASSVAALRTDGLPAITANLISSLFPLEAEELVRLRWQVRPAPKPPLPVGRYEARDGRERALRTKLVSPGLAAYGELSVVADSTARRAQLLRRTASALWSLSTPYGRLAVEPKWFGLLAWLARQRSRYFSSEELVAITGFPLDGPDLPGLELGAAKRLVPSIQLARDGRLLGVSDAPGIDRPVAISEKASTTSLHIIGPTGTGKTTLLKQLISDDLRQNRGLLVMETNGDLIAETLDLIPAGRRNDVVLIDPTDPDFAVGLNPFAGNADPSLVADQIGELFERLWAHSYGPRTAQLAHMGLLSLARRRRSTLVDLPRLYLDERFRHEVVAGLDDPVGLGADWRWFESLSEREAVTFAAPLQNKARVWVNRPAIRSIVGQTNPRISIADMLRQGRVVLVNLPKGLIGTETAQLLGCLVLVSLWQAITERAGLPPEQRTLFSLVVDEAQDFAAAPLPWDEMVAQGRKYGLSLVLAHQNLEQLPKDFREVLLANARSKVVFRLSASDAKVMERHFAPSLSAEDLQSLDPYTVAAQLALDNGGIAKPVTLLTPPPPKPLGTAEAVRAASRRNYARPKAEIEAALRKQAEGRKRPKTPVGRRKRSES